MKSKSWIWVLVAVLVLLLVGWVISVPVGTMHPGGATLVNGLGTPWVTTNSYCGGSCEGQPITGCPDWATLTVWSLGPVSVSVEKSKDCEGYAFKLTTLGEGPYSVEMAAGDISDSLAITRSGSYYLPHIVGSGSGEIQVLDSNGNVWSEHFTLK